MKQANDDLSISNIQVQTLEGESFDIPEEGSLGLLALGHHGLIAWRRKRAEILRQKQRNKDKRES